MSNQIRKTVEKLIKKIDSDVHIHNIKNEYEYSNKLSYWIDENYSFFFNNSGFYIRDILPFQRRISKVMRFCGILNKIYNIYGEGKFND